MKNIKEFYELRNNILFYLLQPAIMMWCTMMLIFFSDKNDKSTLVLFIVTLFLSLIIHIGKILFYKKYKNTYLSLKHLIIEILLVAFYLIIATAILLAVYFTELTEYSVVVLFYSKALYFCYALFCCVFVGMSAQRMFYLYIIFDKQNKVKNKEELINFEINCISQLITKEEEVRILVAHSGVFATVTCILYSIATLMSGLSTLGYYIFALPLGILALFMQVVNLTLASRCKISNKSLCYLCTLINIAICAMSLFFNDVKIVISNGAIVEYRANFFSMIFVVILAIYPIQFYQKIYPRIFRKVRQIENIVQNL